MLVDVYVGVDFIGVVCLLLLEVLEATQKCDNGGTYQVARTQGL